LELRPARELIAAERVDGRSVDGVRDISITISITIADDVHIGGWLIGAERVSCRLVSDDRRCRKAWQRALDDDFDFQLATGQLAGPVVEAIPDNEHAGQFGEELLVDPS
jgi:hypothetical protein